jgi:sulfur-carrier protein
MARLRLFAAAREAAGTPGEVVDADTVAEVLDVAAARYGDEFARLLPTCGVWLNGDEAQGSDRVGPDDEVAVLPPVSGGGP